LRLASLFYDAKEYATALRTLEQAITIAPGEWPYHLLGGLIYRALGNQAEAGRYFDTTRRLNNSAPVPSP
jgi:Flp pilus assembly protein TadD